MAKDIFTREWIIEQALDVLSQYEPGVLTIRALHYQLVSRGMTNDIQHYKRVVLRPALPAGMGALLLTLFPTVSAVWPAERKQTRFTWMKK